MKCPICGKELELKKKQVGTDENGNPIFNEYAICRDCRSSGILTNSVQKTRGEKSRREGCCRTRSERRGAG